MENNLCCKPDIFFVRFGNDAWIKIVMVEAASPFAGDLELHMEDTTCRPYQLIL